MLNMAMQYKILFVLILMWVVVWKGLALWKAGTKRDKIWFIILLIVNTFGILDIIYVYFIANRKTLGPKIVEVKQ